MNSLCTSFASSSSSSSLSSAAHYHAFISHQWGSGQDQARTIKAQLQLLVPGFSAFLDVDDLEELKGYKETFDTGKVPEINWKEVRPYLKLEHFTPEIISGKNSAAGGLCNWVRW